MKTSEEFSKGRHQNSAFFEENRGSFSNHVENRNSEHEEFDSFTSLKKNNTTMKKELLEYKSTDILPHTPVTKNAEIENRMIKFSSHNGIKEIMTKETLKLKSEDDRLSSKKRESCICMMI